MSRQCIKSIFPRGKGEKKVSMITGHGNIRGCLSAVILNQGFKMVKVEAMSILSEFYFEQPVCPSPPSSPQQLLCSLHTANMFVLSKAAGTSQCL